MSVKAPDATRWAWRGAFPVDAVELTHKFADIVRTEVDRQLLDVRVIQRDVFATLDDLRRDYQLIVLSEVVSDFSTTQQLRGLFELATHCLAPDGRLLFNAFLAHDGYTPDDATRELGQQSYTSMFTRDELATAAAGLPLTLLADDSVHDYEKEHLPEGTWPPTSWYPNWTAGQDVFPLQRDTSQSTCVGWSTGLRSASSGPHLVGAVVRLDPFPHPAEASSVGHRLADRAQRPVLLRLRRARLAMHGNGIRAEVANLKIEDLVHDVAVDAGQLRLLENQLPVDDQRKQVPDVEQEVQILELVGIRRGRDEERLNAWACSSNRATFGMPRCLSYAGAQSANWTLPAPRVGP